MTPPNERDIREQEDHDLAEQQLAEHPPCGCGPETACDKHRATPTSPQRAADQQDRVGEVPITCICRHYLNGTVDALHDCPVHGEQPAAPVGRGGPDKVREAVADIVRYAEQGVNRIAEVLGVDANDEYAIADALLALRAAPSGEAVLDEEIGDWHKRAREAVFFARVIARSHGYALAVHGSLRRDIDLVAVPWTEEAIAPHALAQEIVDGLKRYGVDAAFDSAGAKGQAKPRGRHAWSIILLREQMSLTSPTNVMYLDLSVAAPQDGPQSRGVELYPQDCGCWTCPDHTDSPQVTEEMVERAAMQMARHFAAQLPLTRHDDAALAKVAETFKGDARRILTAALPPVPPSAGREVTDQMCKAAMREFAAQMGESWAAMWDQTDERERASVLEDWRHILTAALTPQPTEGR